MKTNSNDWLGVIQPTLRELHKYDVHDDNMHRAHELEAIKLLGRYEQRRVSGELRFYRTPTQYAIYTRFRNITWLEVREDGDYRI